MTKDAFIREVREAEAMLYHVSKSILKNDSDCGDAVQETLLKAYEKLPTLKREKFFRTWITRILINECKGILRRRKNVIPYEDYIPASATNNNTHDKRNQQKHRGIFSASPQYLYLFAILSPSYLNLLTFSRQRNLFRKKMQVLFP